MNFIGCLNTAKSLKNNVQYALKTFKIESLVEDSNLILK